MEPMMSAEFREALRAELIRRAEMSGAPRRPWRWLAGGALVVLFGGSAGLATAQLLSLPGASVASEIGAEMSIDGTGTRVIALGPAPENATAVWFDLTCGSPGEYRLGAGGAAVTCTASDVGTPAGRASGPLPLEVLEGDTFTLAAPGVSNWRLTLAYVDERSTDWAVNESGDSYGVGNESGTPDLVAVVATNGHQGYVRRDELEAADGTAAARELPSPEEALQWQADRAGRSFTIPVYAHDGRTVIGEFVIAG